MNVKIELFNIFFLDWDDCNFATSFILSNNIDISNENDIEEYKLYFIELDDLISNLLMSLDEKGYVFIVTNANIKWIEKCLKILPITKNIIEEKNIQIISARDRYKSTKMSKDWKTYTFKDVIKDMMTEVDDNDIVNIISLGDAKYEYNGLLSLDDYFKINYSDKMYLLKSINFIKNPSFDQILYQLKVMNKSYNEIINKIDYIDFNFE
jgi:hypothetical protein